MHYKDWLLVVIAIFIPPLSVWMKRGFTKDFFINLLLFFLGFIPGLIHALYIISYHATDPPSLLVNDEERNSQSNDGVYGTMA